MVGAHIRILYDLWFVVQMCVVRFIVVSLAFPSSLCRLLPPCRLVVGLVLANRRSTGAISAVFGSYRQHRRTSNHCSGMLPTPAVR